MREIQGEKKPYLVSFKGIRCGGLSTTFSRIGRKQRCKPCPKVGGQRLLTLCWLTSYNTKKTLQPRVGGVRLILSKLLRVTVGVNLLEGLVAAGRCPSSVLQRAVQGGSHSPSHSCLSDPVPSVTSARFQGGSLKKNQASFKDF